ACTFILHTVAHTLPASFSFFSSATAAPDTPPLSLHDALPIYLAPARLGRADRGVRARKGRRLRRDPAGRDGEHPHRGRLREGRRSEEHTSELQSRFDLVCRLLLEKKKKQQKTTN